MGFLQTFLLVFAGVSLVVGVFMIINTFSILVAQRSRELALLRTLGASRRQVTVSVILEALVVGVVGSTIGLGVGYLLARGLAYIFGLIGIDLSRAAFPVEWPTVFWSYVVGIVVTVVAAYLPARRASRDRTHPGASRRRRAPGDCAAPTPLRRSRAGRARSGEPGGRLRRRRYDGPQPDRPRHVARPDRGGPAEPDRGTAGHRAVPGAVPGPVRNGRPARHPELDPQPAAHGRHRQRLDGRAGAGGDDVDPGAVSVSVDGRGGQGQPHLAVHRLQRRGPGVRHGRGRPDPRRRRGGVGRQLPLRSGQAGREQRVRGRDRPGGLCERAVPPIRGWLPRVAGERHRRAGRVGRETAWTSRSATRSRWRCRAATFR